MSKSLFNEFEPVSSKQWKQKIQVDLKGADYNEALIWQSTEGINVKPFYHQDDFKELPEISETNVSNFKICQTIFVDDVKVSNGIALDTISRGAEAIRFIIPSEKVNVEELLKGISSKEINLYFEFQFLNENYIEQIPKENTFVLTDTIGHLVKTGNWFENLNSDGQNFVGIVKKTSSFSVDVSIFQNAGANMIQQLGYAMAQVSEYLNVLDDKLTNDEKAQLVPIFKVSVGTNYFFEIAKLRAIRKLYKEVAEAFGCNIKCHIFSIPTKRNKTLYDYNVNMLRTTTECMSAVLGGADAVNNLAYDAIYHKDNEFGQRISRNQLLILKNESYFNKVDNPADGSYYIEKLTEELSEKGLKLFKEIESNGGFLSQLKSGTIQRKIKESAQKEQAQFDDGSLTLLGTNKYPNAEDKMKDNLELYPFIKMNPVKTLIEPIIPKRLAENYEKSRLEQENAE
ncbi:MAG: methylmalonyl-CoA mutase subunit beta [Bacteroidota bacterium]